MKVRQISAIEGMEPHREGEWGFYYQVGMQTHGGRWVRKIDGRLDAVSRVYWYDIWTSNTKEQPQRQWELSTSINVRAVAQIHWQIEKEKQ